MESGPPPPRNVIHAFGASERDALVPLAGGISQSAWRVGDLVLKPVQDFNPGEGDWVAEVLNAVVEDGFRVIKPVRAGDGRWLEDGWTAWRWLDGEHERTRWRAVVDAAGAFHEALAVAVGVAGVDYRPAWLSTRGHRWAVAEGVVWRGEELPTKANYDVPEWALFERARAAGPPLTADEAGAAQVVHGDIAGNVLVGADGVPAFIDMSPGWRPASSAHTQILVEAFAFFRGDESLLDRVDAADAARAMAFRLLCGFQALVQVPGSFLPPKEIARFDQALDLIGA